MRDSHDPGLAVGLIGLGNMGTAFAERLLDAGYGLVVMNRTPAKAAPLEARGATLAGSYADLAERADVVLTSLADDDALDEVAAALLAVAKPGTVLVDTSTVSPAVSARVAERAEKASVAYTRAPVSGNPTVVRAGNLSFIVSGPSETLDGVEPILLAIGPTVYRVGDAEEARVVKLAINLMIGGLAQLMAEALVLGESSGVSRAALLEVMGRLRRRRAVRPVQDRRAARGRLLGHLHHRAHGERPRPDPRRGGGRGRRAPGDDRAPGNRPGGDRGRLCRRRLHGALPVPREHVSVPRGGAAALTGGDAVSTRSRTNGSPDATRAVDWEQRLDFPRLRRERLERARASLERSELGAVLLFDPNNIRYVTSTHIGEWARDKNARFTLLARGADPILWDFGSAARHHQMFAPWLPEESFRAGVSPMRGAMPVETGIPDRLAAKIAHELRELGLHDEPLGVDMADLVTLEALQRAGLRVTDGSRVLLEARTIKTADEIALLDQSAGLVDAVYDEIYRMLRPGVYEHEIVGRAHQLLFEMGSEQVEAVNAVSGDRCNPHPHVFSDRLLRPGDQAFFDIIHSFMGYRTCYYRTFNIGGVTPSQLDAYKQCREWLDAAIALVRPGMTTDRIAEVWPTAQELGFPDEETCFGLQFGHGIGVGLYESPMISRVHSLEAPVELQEGMVFALETYCAATDGRSAARIEEEVVVTATGCDVLTRFPAEELLVAGRQYVRGADLLRGPGETSTDSAVASGLAAAVASSAVVEPAGVPR